RPGRATPRPLAHALRGLPRVPRPRADHRLLDRHALSQMQRPVRDRVGGAVPDGGVKRDPGNFVTASLVDYARQRTTGSLMRTRRTGVSKRRVTACRHLQQYETDWMGRTYLGCPVCNRWKLMNPKH